MAVPTLPHYWLVRLRALNRPRLWGTGLGLLLLGLVGHQYLGHPEWLKGFVLDEADPARPIPETNLAELSQAELAELAEVDNLTLLLNQLQPLTADALAELSVPPSEAPETLGLPTPPGQAEETSPFAAYLENTRFRVGATADSTPAESAPLSRSRLGLRGATEATEAAPLAPSPLQQFLNPGQNATANSPTAGSPESPPAVGAPPGFSADRTSGTAPSVERMDPTQPTGLTPPPWVVEGNIPGVNQRFIRTTPEMSPPPGTTGYRPPPSLAPIPSGLPSSAPPPGLSPAATPLDLSPGRTSPTAVPSPGVGRGANTLPPPSLSPYTQPPASAEVVPFSAPRPPGSHIGGGHIDTFSNPNGPGD